MYGFADHPGNAALAALITAGRPSQLHTQDFLGTFGDSDHHDHHAAAYLARAASRSVVAAVPHRLVAYQDYPTSARPSNVAPAELAAKRQAFLRYAGHDPKVCLDQVRCLSSNYHDWLKREYVLASE